MKSNKLNIFVCLTCGLIIVGFVFFSSGVDSLVNNFNSLNFWWIAAAVGCMLLYWLLESVILHIMIKPMHKEQKFLNSFRVSMGGQYFNSITPFSSGGQPFQAYYLKKQGVQLGVAINSLLSKFIIYQVALVIISAILLILRLGYFQQKVSNFSFIVLIGFLINLIVMLCLIGFAVFKNTTRKISRGIIRLLAKIRIFKDPDEKIKYMDEELEKFSACFKEMVKDLPTMIYSFLLSIVQLIVYMAVPYMIYKAFGLNEIDFLTIIAAQSFVMMVSSFIPIPGAGVGAEGFFYFFFQQFFVKEGQLGLALILWRLITFYFTIVVGAFFAVKANKKIDKTGLDEAGDGPPPEETQLPE